MEAFVRLYHQSSIISVHETMYPIARYEGFVRIYLSPFEGLITSERATACEVAALLSRHMLANSYNECVGHENFEANGTSCNFQLSSHPSL